MTSRAATTLDKQAAGTGHAPATADRKAATVGRAPASPQDRRRRLEAMLRQKVARSQTFPLSFAQQRLWLLDQLEPGNPVYNVPLALRLRGPVNLELLNRTLNEVVARHETLRTKIATVDGEPVQVVEAVTPQELTLVDLEHLDPADREAEALARAVAEVQKPFRLDQGPLFRAVLLRLTPTEHVLVVVMHHVISDDWSMGVLFREVALLYKAFTAGRPSPLETLPIQYAEYAVWQRQRLQGETLERLLGYWRERLAGLATLGLPTDRPHSPEATSAGATHSVLLPLALAEQLRDVGRREGATLYMTLLAAFQTLLHRYSGQDDVVVGSPIAGRLGKETEGLVGFFVNTLVMRADLGGNPTFRELLAQVRQTALGAFEHQELPFEQLVEAINPERDTSRHPLFQVTFSLENAVWPEVEFADIALAVIPLDTGTSKFDLSLSTRQQSDGLALSAEYNLHLFRPDTIERMLNHFRVLLEGIVADPDRRLSDLPLMDDAERRTLLVDWSGAAVDDPADACVLDLFESQVRRTPDAVALVDGPRQWTYRELDQRANQLAHCLQSRGVGPDQVVAVRLPRSAELIAAFWGVWKAGGAYLPLDPQLPAERLRLTLEDAQADVVVTEERLRGDLPAGPQHVICVDTDREEIAQCAIDPPARQTDAERLAYVIYTSGSTGRPKGVMIEHRALANYARAVTAEYAITAADCVLQFASASFDAHAEEVYPCLTCGGTLVLRNDDMLDCRRFLQLCEQWQVTFVSLPTGFWHELTATIAADALAVPATLRLAVIGGEQALPERMATWFDCVGNRVRLLNTYGPTETTVVATVAELSPADARQQRVPIGRPLANYRTYVLDRFRQPVATGIPGELYVGGRCLARGYLNGPELTAERFVADPFAATTGARMYKTGDVVRWRPDGQLEFLGRTDHQVKIRGFRVELGEIESVLRRHADVRAAVVVARDNSAGGKQLAAYVVANGEMPPSSAELRKFLGESLPDYMIPAAFVPLVAIPLSATGKIDYKALPAPTYQRDAECVYVPPRTSDEELLADIWREVLHVERVGVHDNFFALGGHSLLATQVMSRIARRLKVEVPLRDMFQTPTIAGLAERVAALRTIDTGTARLRVTPVPRDGSLPLSFNQEALWFLDQLEADRATYTIHFALRLGGPLDVPALNRALKEVARRHEVLRTRFPEVDGQPVQVIAPSEGLSLPTIDLSEFPPPDRDAKLRDWVYQEMGRPIDLQNGPLTRLTLLRLGGEEHVMVVAAHHIIYDGWSLGIMARELAVLYGAYGAGRPSPLPELPIQYADFAVWQRRFLQGQTLERLQSYWVKQLADLPPLELPTDHPRPAIRTTRGATLPCALSDPLSAAVREFCRREGVTPFMALLAGLQVLLQRYSGQQDIAVGSPVANRLQAEVEPLIGYFVNVVVLRTQLSGDPCFREVVQRVRQVALEAYEHQELTLDRVVSAVNPTRDLSHSPLFQVMFALQNNEEASLEGAGLTIEPLAGQPLDRSENFELTLSLDDTAQGFRGAISYNTDLFAPDTIGRMIRNYAFLLGEVLADPDRRLSQIALANEEERRTVLDRWNETACEFDRAACVHRLFETHAQQRPGATAVVLGDRRWTYDELNRRANQLAHYLRRQGVGPEVTVGIFMDRSPELVMAVLAVLKAGGAYVPLDPAHAGSAEERLAFMLREAGASLVITEPSIAASLGTVDARLIVLGGQVTGELEEERTEDPDGGATADNLAYILYTSGSTGRPKGVMITHGNLLNAYHGWQREYRLGSEVGSHLQMASFGFDVFTGDWVRALCSGGKLVVCRQEIFLSAPELLELIAREQIDIAEFVPVVLRTLLQHLEDAGRTLTSMRMVIAGSDAWYVADHKQARRLLGPETRLINSYGLTETTIDSCCFEGEVESTVPSGLTPIGRPFANVRLYVLDEHQRPTPIGVAGELYIGGHGIARGYVNAELNAARFVADPFVDVPGARMCRTGDRARWRADGQVEFLGRADNQVKIRGFRIEPSEVEQVLREHPLLAAAVVVARERAPGDLRLVAYTAAWDGAPPTPTEMRLFLRARLPEYMIPSTFVALSALPVTTSGKVDRRALPEPDWSVGQREGEYVAPRTPAEQQLASIWSEVLGVQKVGSQDNFFDLGGNSLLALRLISRVRRAFSIDLPLVALFTAPILSELAARIAVLQAAGRLPELPPIQPVTRDGLLPASYGQEELWVIGHLQQGPSPYVLCAAARLRGPLHEQALEHALNEVLRRHESLRTTFAEVDGRLVQVIAPPAHRSLAIVDLSELPPEEREREVRRYAEAESQRPLDLAEGPLARIESFRLSADEHVVLVAMHHIIYDGWSMGVLSRELLTAYVAFAAGLPLPLPELPIQYADFAAWQRQRLQGEVLTTLRDYWLKQLAGLPALELPTDRPRPEVRTTHGADCERQLSSQLSQAVKRLGNEEGTTTFMTLLAAFQILLHRYSGQDDFAVGTPVAGRLRPETEDLIGYFINDLVLRADLAGDPSFRQLLARVRETVLQAFDHQEMPFLLLVRELNPPRDPGQHPLIQAELVLHNTPSGAQELPELELRELGSDAGAAAVDLDLSMIAYENEQGIRLSLEYRTDLFDEATIERMLEHLTTLLEAVTANPDQRLSQLFLQALPHVPDGKLSRSAALAPARPATTKRPYAAPRSHTEKQLSAIWAKALRLDRVGLHDNFFEMGGHSLLVVQTMVQVRTALGVELPIAALFAAPTVAEMAERVEAARHSETPSSTPETPSVERSAASLLGRPTGNGRSLAPLRKGGSATPLFCIHGLGGHVAALLPLARALAQGRPVYGLQGLGLDAGRQPHDRIEDMAAFYLDEMRQVQPRGPYLLAGWSLGGLIALEATQQLATAGEEVALLAMLDTYLSTPDYEELELTDQSVIRWIAPHLNLSVKELKKLPLERQWQRIAEQANLAEGVGVVEIRRLAAVCRAHLAAAARYQPRPYLGRAVLFQADAGRNAIDRRWKSLCPRLRTERVPGNHYSMLRKPHVDTLAERLGRYIEEEVDAGEAPRNQ
jgi:amino acid adenylation domain-containing protein